MLSIMKSIELVNLTVEKKNVIIIIIIVEVVNSICELYDSITRMNYLHKKKKEKT